MPSPFDNLDAALQAAMDQAFGEGIRVAPMSGDPNYGGAPDDTRPAADTRAVVSRSASNEPTDFSNTNRQGVALTVGPAELWIDRVAYAALGYRLKRGDHIIFTDEGTAPNHPRGLISAVNDGDYADVQILFTAHGVAA